MPCGSPRRLDSIRVSPDRRLLASPRSLSQLTAPFVAIPSQAIHHTASLCRMILTSPADACANPMHGNIAGVARESAVRTPLALPMRFIIAQCIPLNLTGLCFFISFTVRTNLPICSKEVIRLQVPLQPPCYDFSPLA